MQASQSNSNLEVPISWFLIFHSESLFQTPIVELKWPNVYTFKNVSFMWKWNLMIYMVLSVLCGIVDSPGEPSSRGEDEREPGELLNEELHAQVTVSIHCPSH